MKLKSYFSDPTGHRNPTVSVHGLQALEELLPGIDDFLVNTLSKENLSSLAERKRQYYVERLEFLSQPPSLPPRPAALPKVTDSPKLAKVTDSPKLPPALPRRPSHEKEEEPPPPPPLRPRKSLLPRPQTYTPTPLPSSPPAETPVVHTEQQDDDNTTAQEDFAAKQRRIAREASSDAIAPPPLLPRTAHLVPPPVPDPIDDSDHYSDIDRDDFGSDGRSVDGDIEDMYEVPTNVTDTPSSSNNNLADKISHKEPESDTESGTSYESYDDEQPEKHVDADDEENVAPTEKQEDGDSLGSEKRKSRDDIPLPRIKSKKKKVPTATLR